MDAELAEDLGNPPVPAWRFGQSQECLPQGSAENGRGLRIANRAQGDRCL
ncbi:MAG: hypothetical protein HY782_15640 [Chloroflexi bacterium]|nr:hypothetical protein [Chloroflexota bacterium]